MKIDPRKLKGVALQYATILADGDVGIPKFTRNPYGHMVVTTGVRPDIADVIAGESMDVSLWKSDGKWHASQPHKARWSDVDGEFIEGSDFPATGTSLSDAVLRSYTFSKFGTGVEIPDELLEGNIE